MAVPKNAVFTGQEVLEPKQWVNRRIHVVPGVQLITRSHVLQEYSQWDVQTGQFYWQVEMFQAASRSMVNKKARISTGGRQGQHCTDVAVIRNVVVGCTGLMTVELVWRQ